jgi:hypothetical protein
MKLRVKPGFVVGFAAIIVTVLVVYLVWNHKSDSTLDHKYDVIVVGAGPSGIAASLQAARSGTNVALLEETSWIGGQMTTAGVGTMDEGNPTERNSGIYKEFVAKARQYYASRGQSISTCYYNTDSICIDPRDGQQILREMLNAENAHLRVVTDTQVTDVIKDNNAVVGVTTAKGMEWRAQVVVDASEYGDVIAKSGAAYRLGNSSDNVKPDACIQSITYPVILKKYPHGVPAELQIKQKPEGYDKVKARFAKFVTSNGQDITKSHHYPVNFAGFAAYRGLPDTSNSRSYNSSQPSQITRSVLNLGNDYPFYGNLKASYVEDMGLRAKTNCEAKQLTLQFIYYLQNELGQKDWSIADDEGYNSVVGHCAAMAGFEAFEKHMPPEPYVREARRLIGVETLAGNDIKRIKPNDRVSAKRFSDSIAVGYYPIDMHGCNQPKDLETGLDRPDDITSNSGPFEVPMGALIPQKLDGLLAAEKNISTSRLAEGAIRLQPISMATGQAAGALAALAAQYRTEPRNIQASEVQEQLRRSGATVTIP